MTQEDYIKLVESVAGMNKDYKIVVEDTDLDTNFDEKPVEKNIRQEIRDAIKPQVEIADALITTIKDAFADNFDQTNRMDVMQIQKLVQIKLSL